MSTHDAVQTILVFVSLANAMYGTYWAALREQWAKGAFYMALAAWVIA